MWYTYTFVVNDNKTHGSVRGGSLASPGFPVANYRLCNKQVFVCSNRHELHVHVYERTLMHSLQLDNI